MDASMKTEPPIDKTVDAIVEYLEQNTIAYLHNPITAHERSIIRDTLLASRHSNQHPTPESGGLLEKLKALHKKEAAEFQNNPNLTPYDRLTIMGKMAGYQDAIAIAAMGDASTRKDEEEKNLETSPAKIHDSDCAMHNEPAMPNGPCDCSARCEISGNNNLMLVDKDEYLRLCKVDWCVKENGIDITRKPEPVSIAVCVEAMKRSHYSVENQARTCLAAAGVKYAD